MKRLVRYGAILTTLLVAYAIAGGAGAALGRNDECKIGAPHCTVTGTTTSTRTILSTITQPATTVVVTETVVSTSSSTSTISGGTSTTTSGTETLVSTVYSTGTLVDTSTTIVTSTSTKTTLASLVCWYTDESTSFRLDRTDPPGFNVLCDPFIGTAE